MHFFLTIFLFFSIYYVQNSFRLSLPFLLLCLFDLADLSAGLRLCCCSVVLFALPFSKSVEAYLFNFCCCFSLFLPLSYTIFCRLEMCISAGLSLSLCCVRAGVPFVPPPFPPLCLFLFVKALFWLFPTLFYFCGGFTYLVFSVYIYVFLH